jgi:hypothetical protein
MNLPIPREELSVLLAAIKDRALKAPGRCFSVGCGLSVSAGYAERFLNNLNETPLYIRKKNGQYPTDQSVADSIADVFKPAYQAHLDVDVLLALLEAAAPNLVDCEKCRELPRCRWHKYELCICALGEQCPNCAREKRTRDRDWERAEAELKRMKGIVEVAIGVLEEQGQHEWAKQLKGEL